MIPICEHCHHDYIDRTDHSNCDGADSWTEAVQRIHPTIDTFDPAQVVTQVEIHGIYDGVCAYLMRDGSWVNRFRLDEGWGTARPAAVDAWIAEHGPAVAREALAGPCTIGPCCLTNGHEGKCQR